MRRSGRATRIVVILSSGATVTLRPLGHARALRAHVVPTVIALGDVHPRVVLDAVPNLFWHPSLAGERLPGPAEIAIGDDRDDAEITLPPPKPVERTVADGSFGILLTERTNRIHSA